MFFAAKAFGRRICAYPAVWAVWLFRKRSTCAVSLTRRAICNLGGPVVCHPNALYAKAHTRCRSPATSDEGFDAGKKVTGLKRHILVDTLGLLLSVAVHPANIQDRDGIALVLSRRTRRLFSPSSNRFLPTAATRDQKRLQPQLEQATGKFKSSGDLIPQSASRSYRSDGLSNERSPGSVASVVLLEILSATPEPSQPLSISLWSASCYDA